MRRLRPTIDLREIQAERVCLIKPSSLGDVIQALPVLTALRRRFPSARLAWVLNRGYERLLEGHPHLDEIIPFDRAKVGLRSPSAPLELMRFLTRLRGRRFDLTIDLQGLLRSGVMTAGTGAKRRIGLSSAREGAAWFYTDVVLVPTMDMQSVDRYWLVAEALGVGDGTKEFIVPIGLSDKAWAAAHLACLPRPIMAINAGARWVTKRWPPANFADVARRACDERGAGLVLVGGPGEEELAREVERLTDRSCVNLAGRMNLKQLAAVLQAADLVLTNDSGPMHLAAAVGTPVVAVFTCTSPVRTGPYGPRHIAVQSKMWCAPSYFKTCGRMECMAELTPSRVWPVLMRQLMAIGDGERRTATA